ncbi:uroporphyrinogen decarboxylase family protein [Methylomonas sp. LL1]|uniref:uroporphyrinogen decarboxylase family protein n=1 Tax=Methylomonas sp. LL1 TaxID=2785785 RepID=UPI0018C3BC86|nr:uroporphyrinogen decarboxylase family protein [Methylomonas sp. LL1]QPK64795.1 uroporphyrinogen decarboxylase family protein [Methylomonas sp. LL1]
MNSMQRVLTTLSFKEPDRVPLFLFTGLQGAGELGLSIEDYFSRSDYVVEGQMRLLKKYRGDCITGFFYAAIELQAWGGEAIFQPDCPPNAGPAIIRRPEDIDRLRAPRVADSPLLLRVLETIRQLKARVGDTVPIIGIVISPFSLPVIQMGFDRYIELIYEQPERLAKLMRINEDFCVEWANAQLAAGATAVGYFDPVSSVTIIPRELYLQTGQQVAMRTLARINGPAATHLASGRCLPIIDDIAATGSAGLGVSALEDLAALKAAAQGKLTLIGNLNGIEMRRWTAEQAEREVKSAIAKAGRGGGFILADNHGEIPWQVPEQTLLAIADAVERWGRYPLDWIE